MIIGVWLIGILPAMLLLGWLDNQCSREEPDACFGSSFGMAVVFWPLTFCVFLLTLVLVYFCGFEDFKTIEARKEKDAK